jgi:hypothetical protein
MGWPWMASTQTHHLLKLAVSGTRTQIATTIQTVCFTNHITATSNTMTHTRKRKMSWEKCSLRSVPKKKRNDCMEDKETYSRTQEHLQLTEESMEQMRWPDRLPTAKQMIQTSICRSSRGFCVNISLYLSLLTETAKHSLQTLSHLWWNLDLIVLSHLTGHSYLP